MLKLLRDLSSALAESALTLTPLALVLLGFAFALGAPLPAPGALLYGGAVLVLGLTLVVKGLELTLFPLAEGIAGDLVGKGSLGWLLLFALTLGFGATVAEPALAAVAGQVARSAVAHAHIHEAEAAAFAWGLRLATASGIALGVALGILRIVRGWSLPRLLVALLLPLLLLSRVVPPPVATLAFDMGISAMSTLAVPVVVALGIGLAGSLGRRSALIDGFGMAAPALLVPPLCVLAWGWMR